MELLQAGVDCSVIALWLGHESVETTQTYLHAHLALKEAALAKLKPTSAASEPASSRTTACSPFWRRSERQTMPNGVGLPRTQSTRASAPYQTRSA
ncbi:hypothetical protein [Bradyrhizobium septentrionale]